MDAIFIVLAIPIFLVTMLVEYLLGRRRGRRLYVWQDSVGNLSNGIGSQIFGTWFLPIAVVSYSWVYQHARLATQSPRSVVAWVVLFFAVDLGYWLFHWASHRVNFFWAMHAVHHQSEEYNLSVALRQSWLDPLVSWVFYIPLAVAGFPVGMYLAMTTLNTLYQFWIHTRLVGRMGWLEHFLNTPSHHRVHHGINPRYIDRNYAGVLIIWDRLFGTFEPEADEPVYGVVKPLSSFSAVKANTRVWLDLGKTARATRRLRDKLLVFVKPPEWRPADLGGPVVVPEPSQTKFEVPSTRRRDVWVGVQFLLATGATAGFLYGQGKLSPLVTLAIGLGVVGTIVGWDLVYRPPRAAPAMAQTASNRRSAAV